MRGETGGRYFEERRVWKKGVGTGSPQASIEWIRGTSLASTELNHASSSTRVDLAGEVTEHESIPAYEGEQRCEW